MALTYTTLQVQIERFLNRDDLGQFIPTFIQMAEAGFNREIRHWQMEKRSEATFNERYEPLPTDWLETRRVSVNGCNPVNLISQDKMLELRAKSNNQAGEPRHYTLSASQIELFPTPDGNYDASMIYTGAIEELSATVATNWLLTSYPDIYIYGSLMHSAPFLQEDARLPVWAGLYKDAVAALNAASDAGTHSGTGLVMR